MAKARTTVKTASRQLRCAIYTRKSTEDGLEQEFNSLDAQREACAAYVLSQRHEGWTLVPGRYDDGGFSGGTMERPGLKRLLADIEAGRVDVIVVYKVDRLTRSLADFAKIVDVLDARGASFVSITQAFNTTSSMGRLTLNVLLSFAQFEREVTGERIRDKIAASKKKGLWMGGPVPLGYEVRDRKLVVNQAEAELVRHIMRRYIALRSVNELVEELARDGHRTKVQRRASGPHKGGCPFHRGTLYHLLANRIYLGQIVHKGVAHPGEHEAIVPPDLWDAVQDKLAARGPGRIVKREGLHRSALTGILVDGLGRPMTPNHAVKGAKRYHYYVTREPSAAEPAWRVAAQDIERIVAARVEALLRDRNRLARLVAAVDPRQVETVAAAAERLATTQAILADPAAIGLEQIGLHEDRIEIILRARDLLRACNVTVEDDLEERITLTAPVSRVRRGHELRLVIPGEGPAEPPVAGRNERLVALLAEAIEVRDSLLAAPGRSLHQIAHTQGKCRKRLAKLIRLSWLVPEIVRAILEGSQPATLTPRALLDAELALDWRAQRAALGMP
ncbi:hypothetical protein CLG96_04305 [Sphingomonas oleivorans]|uniref:Resolvase n=1 Tax=Sphingomonas oleivorans TaxID=1735121 RepID=A0A2T5G2F1_9SPHN|nr:recombinase family protein [Sphingomonas oleivorans]PTQ13329.1 hypothetical protein CLG96_04305 [Sphingomonas oleivorans]